MYEKKEFIDYVMVSFRPAFISGFLWHRMT